MSSYPAYAYPPAVSDAWAGVPGAKPEYEHGDGGGGPDRGISRTPSPTPSEADELTRQHIVDFRAVLNWRYWARRQWLNYYIAGFFAALLTTLITVYHSQIVKWLTPATNWMHGIPFGWLIPVAVLFVISFPPLFGHEIVAVLCGLVWGLGPGFAIVAAGTFIGEIGNFYAFKYMCRERGEKMERTKIMYACIARVVREGGLKIALIARFSAIPGHFTTAIFSTCGMSIWVFCFAAFLSLPKQFATVYLGVILEQASDGKPVKLETRIAQYSVVAVTVAVTIVAGWYMYAQANKVKPAVIYERRKRRQAKGGYTPAGFDGDSTTSLTTLEPRGPYNEPLSTGGAGGAGPLHAPRARGPEPSFDAYAAYGGRPEYAQGPPGIAPPRGAPSPPTVPVLPPPTQTPTQTPTQAQFAPAGAGALVSPPLPTPAYGAPAPAQAVGVAGPAQAGPGLGPAGFAQQQQQGYQQQAQQQQQQAYQQQQQQQQQQQAYQQQAYQQQQQQQAQYPPSGSSQGAYPAYPYPSPSQAQASYPPPGPSQGAFHPQPQFSSFAGATSPHSPHAPPHFAPAAGSPAPLSPYASQAHSPALANPYGSPASAGPAGYFAIPPPAQHGVYASPPALAPPPPPGHARVETDGTFYTAHGGDEREHEAPPASAVSAATNPYGGYLTPGLAPAGDAPPSAGTAVSNPYSGYMTPPPADAARTFTHAR